MFIIIAERDGVQIYNRKEFPSDALKIAEDRIRSGAEKVSVFTSDGAFISASALKQLAQEQADVRPAQREIGAADPSGAISHADRCTTKGETIRVGDSAAETKAEKPVVTPAKARVRFFKARKA